MKKKVALLLASVLTLASVAPTTVFAASKNQLSGDRTGLPKKTIMYERTLGSTEGSVTSDKNKSDFVGIDGVKYAAQAAELTLYAQNQIRGQNEAIFDIELTNGKFYYTKDSKVQIPGTNPTGMTFNDGKWFTGSNLFGTADEDNDARDYQTLKHVFTTSATVPTVQDIKDAKIAVETADFQAAVAKELSLAFNASTVSSTVADVVAAHDFVKTFSIAGIPMPTTKAEFVAAVTKVFIDLNGKTEMTTANVVLNDTAIGNAASTFYDRALAIDSALTINTAVKSVQDAVNAVKASLTAVATTINDVHTSVEKAVTDADTAKKAAVAEVDSLLALANVADGNIPYSMEVDRSRTSARITVDWLAVEAMYANSTAYPYGKDLPLTIPLVLITQDDKDVEVQVKSSASVFENTRHRIMTHAGGSTTTTVKSVKEGRNSIVIDTLKVQENRLNVLKSGGWFRLTAPVGYYFSDALATKDVDGIFSVGAKVISTFFNNTANWGYSDYQTEMYVYLELTGLGNVPGGFYIDNLTIAPETDNEAFDQDLKLTIEGITYANIPSKAKPSSQPAGTGTGSLGIGKQEIVVAKRVDWVVDLKVKEVPEFLSGFRNKNAGQVTFSEKVANAWFSEQSTTFSLTNEKGEELKEAKFTGVKFKAKNIDENAMALASGDWSGKDGDYLYQRQDSTNVYSSSGRYTSKKAQMNFDVDLGNEFTFYNIDRNRDKKAEIVFDFKISTQAGFEGPVYLKVGGRGVRDEVTPVKIAEVVVPVKVTTKSTPAQIGHTNYKVASIEVTETKFGRLKRNETIAIDLIGEYTTNDRMEFAEIADSDITISGDTQFAVRRISSSSKFNDIRMRITRESTKDAATVRIDNVKVHIDRSVPYGNYDLLVGGTAISDNGFEDGPAVVINTTTTKADNTINYDEFRYGGIVIDDYITVDTPPSSIVKNNVKVTQNSEKVVVNGVEADLGAKAYINEAGNMMVPVRFVAYALGLKESDLVWDAYQSKAFINVGEDKVVFTSHSEFMNIAGQDRTMLDQSGNAVKAEITGERMFIPFRALGEAFNIEVTWHEDTKVAEYNPNVDYK